MMTRLAGRWLWTLLWAGALAVCLPVVAQPQSRVEPEAWRPVAQPDLARALDAAPPLRFEEVVEGPDTCWAGPEWWVPNPDGKSWDLVLFYYPKYMGPHEVFVFDFGTGEQKKLALPEGAMFHLRPTFVLEGKLYVIPAGGGLILTVYDPAANEFTFHGVLDPKVRTEANEPAIREDGVIFGLGSAGTQQPLVYRIDPSTRTVRVHEPFGPKNPNMAGIYAKNAVEDDWFYAAYGNRPWRLVAFNIATGEGKVLAETEDIIGDHRTMTLSPLPDHKGFRVTVRGLRGRGSEPVEFWLHEGALHELAGEATPWSAAPLERPRRSFALPRRPPGIEVRRTPPGRDGAVAPWFKLSGDAARTAQAWLPEGADAAGWNKFQFPVTFYPAEIRRMAALQDGRIFAVTEGYGRAVLLDPVARTREVLGGTMSVYSMTTHQNKVIMGGYGGGQVWVYDPTKPWTANVPDAGEEGGAGRDAPPAGEEPGVRRDTNPALVARLAEFSHVQMPFGGAAVAGDGRYYFAGRVIRIGNGGGLGWYDPADGEAGGLFEPFTADQIFWMCTAEGGRYLVLSTKPVQDDRDPTIRPERGSLFVFDTQQRKLVHKVASPNWNVPGPVVEALPGLVLGHGTRADPNAPGVLYGFHPATGRILWEKPVPFQPTTAFAFIRRHRNFFDLGPDGFIWSIVGGKMVRIDPRNAEVHVVGDAREGHQVVFQRGEAYIGGATKLRRIVGIEPLLRRVEE